MKSFDIARAAGVSHREFMVDVGRLLYYWEMLLPTCSRDPPSEGGLGYVIDKGIFLKIIRVLYSTKKCKQLKNFWDKETLNARK